MTHTILNIDLQQKRVNGDNFFQMSKLSLHKLCQNKHLYVKTKQNILVLPVWMKKNKLNIVCEQKIV